MRDIIDIKSKIGIYEPAERRLPGWEELVEVEAAVEKYFAAQGESMILSTERVWAVRDVHMYLGLCLSLSLEDHNGCPSNIEYCVINVYELTILNTL